MLQCCAHSALTKQTVFGWGELGGNTQNTGTTYILAVSPGQTLQGWPQKPLSYRCTHVSWGIIQPL